MKKKILLIPLVLLLAISLVATGCPAPAEVPEEIAKLEEEVAAEKAKVAAEKAKVAELEDEIAALKVPVKVQKWEPSSWAPAGVTWDTLVYMSDYITRMSDGRIVATPSAPGAVVPVAEQLDAVALGTTEAMVVWPGYFPGKIPVTFIHGDCFGGPRTAPELRYLYEVYEGGRIQEILVEEHAKFGVHLVGNVYWILDNIMISRVPLYGIDDLEGMAFRTSELVALQVAHLGAGTVWVPGPEIYTLLATGAVDAITFSNAADMVAASFHEVTSYWVRKPVAVGPAADGFYVNPDVWQALSDDLKAIVEAAVEVGAARNLLVGPIQIDEAWRFVEDYGIEIIEWSEEDQVAFAATARVVVPEEYFEDPAFAEMFDIIEQWMLEQGYW